MSMQNFGFSVNGNNTLTFPLLSRHFYVWMLNGFDWFLCCWEKPLVAMGEATPSGKVIFGSVFDLLLHCN